MDMAFIIPAFNEQGFIENTIDSIFLHAGKNSEIVVIDNGSTDQTATIAAQHGATVYSKPDGSIGALRNFGVSKTSADCLVFIDADVTLTNEWQLGIESVQNQLLERPKLVTGSHCAPPPGENWFLKYWFQAFAEDDQSSHVGTGHMIITRIFFLEIGGFEETLITGEDYELCQRAVECGGEVRNNTGVPVYHHDFPLTIQSFVKREMWHGVGDVGSINKIIASKVALASLVFFSFHLGMIASMLLAPAWVLIFLLLIIMLCVASSVAKYLHSGFKSTLINALIFYLYYCGRTASFFYAIKINSSIGANK